MKMRVLLNSKIHNAVITKTELNYSGSIGIDKSLLLKSDIVPGEKVHVLNFNNGNRFETYVIEEGENSGIIALYGPAARCGMIGDKICIISYILVTEDEIGTFKEKILLLDNNNRVIDST
ncbi:MAG: aspartate 1-decarboxylase [Nitrospirota bacterium]